MTYPRRSKARLKRLGVDFSGLAPVANITYGVCLTTSQLLRPRALRAHLSVLVYLRGCRTELLNEVKLWLGVASEEDLQSIRGPTIRIWF